MAVQKDAIDDAIRETTIREVDIKETPAFGTDIDTSCIMGMAKIDGGVKILLNIDCVLSANEIEALEKVV